MQEKVAVIARDSGTRKHQLPEQEQEQDRRGNKEENVFFHRLAFISAANPRVQRISSEKDVIEAPTEKETGA